MLINISPDTEVPLKQAQADIQSFLALRAIADYVPHNPAHSIEAASAAYDALRNADEHVLLAENALAAARDAVMEARRQLRDVIIGAKNEVRVRYGLNSNELASLGLKKKNDHAKHSSPTKKASGGE